MALTKDSVLDALKGISVSGGIDLLSSGVLSEIVIHKDKVYFALNVPQKDARVYEPVRKAAEEAVNAVFDAVTSALRRGDEVRLPQGEMATAGAETQRSHGNDQ